MRKILIVATAAVMIALAAQAAKTAKAVFEDDRATLRFVYDENDCGKTDKLYARSDGGEWENAFIYTFGEGLADGSTALMNIAFDANGKPVIITTPVVEGHDDFTPAVIGTPNLQNWTSPVVLENKSGDDWTLPVGASANFFRVRLSE